MDSEQYGIPVVYYRGGTSKALFFKEDEIPERGPLRDAVLKRTMGTPDALQIDGMGGSNLVTSKIAIVKKSEREDADVEYTFAQVGIEDDTIGYDANCGNISSAVGPFSIDEGLLEKYRPGKLIDGKIPTQEVRIWCSGTKVLLVAHVAVNIKTRRAAVEGNTHIDGVPGTGAPILVDWRETGGGTSGKGVLPTGNVVDQIEVDGEEYNVTICDIGNMLLLIEADQLGVDGSITKDTFDGNQDLINKIHSIRRVASVRSGMAKSVATADREARGFLCTIIVSKATDSTADIQARFILYNKCHTAMAGTGAVCLAAASRIEGTVVNSLISKERLQNDGLIIQHPSGNMKVWVEKHSDSNKFKVLAFERTARRVVDGKVYVPTSLWPGPQTTETSLAKVPPVTQALSEFVANTTTSEVISNERLREVMKQSFLDFIGLTGYASSSDDIESSPSFFKAVENLDNSKSGSTVLGYSKRSFSQQFAAFLNGTMAHSMDFDDTCAIASLHPGAPIISAALSEAESRNSLGADFITALAVGYEVTCRLGRACQQSAYENGFHMTGVMGIFGAVAAIAKLRNFDAEEVASAFGIAGSRAAGSMQYLANGAWNKRAHPGFAAYDAVFCAELAQSGMLASTEAFEGKDGVFKSYSGNVKYDGLIDNLRSEWVAITTAIKPYPACRMTHSGIEATDILKLRSGKKRTLEEIEYRINPVLHGVVGDDVPNKRHPKNVVDAQFSMYYQAAATWIWGKSDGWNIYRRLEDPSVEALLDRVKVVADATSTLRLGCVVKATYTDGTTDSVTLKEPMGEPSNPLSWEAIEEKFCSLAPFHDNQLVMKVIRNLENVGGLDQLMQLLRR
jgi:2-methylaconitate cis-trans-isomerase PrpF/2-methylcitrate dehydratase PrpD